MAGAFFADNGQATGQWPTTLAVTSCGGQHAVHARPAKLCSGTMQPKKICSALMYRTHKSSSSQGALPHFSSISDLEGQRYAICREVDQSRVGNVVHQVVDAGGPCASVNALKLCYPTAKILCELSASIRRLIRQACLMEHKLMVRVTLLQA